MKGIKDFTVEDIEKMDYNQIIGIVKETNRPPGGRNSVFEVINRLHLTEKSRILEIGTSTGFTPIEISRLVKCRITSIDINEESLKEAKRRASEEDYDNIEFIKADVSSLPFDSETFDVVIVGNVFSLVKNKKRALDECMRVSKKNGFIVAIPMYYIKEPPKEIIKKVSEAIKVNIAPKYKQDWIDFFLIPRLEIYWSKDFKFSYIEDRKISEFCANILKRRHLQNLKKETYEKLSETYKNFMFLFRNNLSYMGYTIFILSKRKLWEDPELYTSEPLNEN